MQQSPAQRLRNLRARAGISMQAIAKAAGYRGASSYQRYEDDQVFGAKHLPLKLVTRIADVLVGKGSPPITQAEVLQLAGINASQSTPARGDIIIGGFTEDGAEPLRGAPIDGLALAEHVAPFLVLSDTMDRHPLKLRAGDVALVDCSGETVDSIQMGDAVVVQCQPRSLELPPRTLIMQVVSPLLLVTNSSGSNYVLRIDDQRLGFEAIVRGRVVSVVRGGRLAMPT